MKKYSIILIIALVYFSACQEPQVTLPSVYNCNLTMEDDSDTHPHAAAYQNELDELTKYLPGVQLTVMTDDGKMWSGAAGMADIPNKVAMQPCHKTMVGSISKTFTGVMILQLQEEGLLTVNDKLSDWLDQELIAQIANANEVTLRNLLNHDTGIPDYLNAEFHFDAINKPFYKLTQTEKMELIQGKNAEFAVGEKYSYSNSNYVLLGLVIEKARNMPLWDVVRIHITEPLGLENTMMGTHDDPIPAGVARPYLAVRNYEYVDIMQNSVSDAATGDGGIISCTQDLVLFMNYLRSGSLISLESFDKMRALAIPSSDGDSYGLGIETIDTDYGTAYGHDGSTSSYLAFLTYFEEQNVTMAIAFNGASEKSEAYDKIRLLADNVQAITFE